MIKKIGFGALGFVLLATPLISAADTEGDLQTRLQALLSQVRALQAQIEQLHSNSGTAATLATSSDASSRPTTPVLRCPVLSRPLVRGTNGSDVEDLQHFLKDNGEFDGDVTGFFGPLTEHAVQQWQAQQGIVSSGDATSTGWGAVGSQTRAFIARRCSNDSPEDTTAPHSLLPPPPPTGSTTAPEQTTSLTPPPPPVHGDDSENSVPPPTYTLVPLPPPTGTITPDFNSYAQASYYSQASYYAQASYTTPAANASATITTSPLSFTTSRPSVSGTASNISSLVINFVNPSDGIGLFPYDGAKTPVVNGVWTYTADRSLSNGTWSLVVADPGTKVPLTSGTVTISTAVAFGTYIGYLNGAQFIQTRNIPRADALANCQLNATYNPTKTIRCVWNEEEIYNNTPVTATTPTATIDSSVYATQTTVTPTISGTASGVTQVDVKVNADYGTVYDSGAIAVSNGRWSFTVPSGKLSSGSGYRVYVYTTTGTLLTNGNSAIFYISVTTPTVDLKVNGSDGPVALSDLQPITVTWTSTGVASCGIYGVWDTLTSSYANITNLPTSGTRSVYAYVPSYTPFSILLRCSTSATVPVPYDDSVSVTAASVTPPPPPPIGGQSSATDPNANLANALTALQSVLDALLLKFQQQ